MAPKLILVLGGAASGKSAFAEALTEGAASRVYLATAQAFDDEMRAKIGKHVDRRGAGWRTVETPLNAADELRSLAEDDVCLFDCATLWLSNHLLAETELEAETDRLLDALAETPARVICVTNEVGHGIVPDNALSRRFREAQGRLNIRLAAAADCVVQVTVGLPNILKGELP